MKHFLSACLSLALSLSAANASADSQKLRVISWADYIPADLIAAFKKETGIDVEVTLSNNEEMISKLRATGGAAFTNPWI
jgi:spermidine/putrescine transport system substrate-binding protein